MICFPLHFYTLLTPLAPPSALPPSIPSLLPFSPSPSLLLTIHSYPSLTPTLFLPLPPPHHTPPPSPHLTLLTTHHPPYQTPLHSPTHSPLHPSHRTPYHTPHHTTGEYMASGSTMGLGAIFATYLATAVGAITATGTYM